MPSLTSEPSDHDRVGAELVRSARRASGARYRGNAVGPLRRFARGFGEPVGEGLAEGVVALVSLALFAGVVALTLWGWRRSVVATIGVYVAIIVFLLYGMTVLWRTWRAPSDRSRRTRLASGVAVSVAIIAIWLVYVASYR